MADAAQRAGGSGVHARRGVLRGDGKLILAVQKPDGAGEVIAVQTRSPALAAIPLAGPRGDNGGTAWTR